MRRFGMVARTAPERREEYLALHRAVWPGVEATITACGIRNFTIFVTGDVLFGYYEYIGDDYAADQRRMAADPVTQEWWARTGPCQRPFDESSGAANWVELDEAWHLD
ncbi:MULTISPECIES: L-rhamnose mutarotase [Microbacterium]|uniref:L-rhamnose mutarotase n=2 Tax=Microbacterium ginsengisoli TaxID=400772 RepID=A0A0F0LU29_9MICO|nr:MULTISPECIES: L-rhamnose mutarotase [Microbacterium]KJL36224.1 L-rhamnose mutarotase [Microbacterium ginsengisoli]MCK9915502.1 L-rhamnose mutarotase [Microbacteriaceae bacterium K1510]